MRSILAGAALILMTGAASAQPSGAAGTTAGAQTPAASINPTSKTTASPSPSAVQTNNTMARTAAAPVPGRNSFTQGEAARRIASAGFTDLKALKKDDQGIWRGQAMKDGAAVAVALDYQGNVVGQ